MIKSNELLKVFDIYIKDPKCELKFNKDYELLLSVMLSAQSTDKRVNEVTSILFKKYDSLKKLDNLTLEEVKDNIKTIGMYNTKAKNFKNIVSSLLLNGGYVPNDRKFLENLSGVGRKSANVVLAVLYNVPCIAVDTHVTRVSKRLGLVYEKDDVVKIENKLMKYFPKEQWINAHYQMVLFGRYYCLAIKPKCEYCLLKENCKHYKNSND